MKKRNGFFLYFLFSIIPLSASETRIKGQRMELLNKGETVYFKGEVRMERGEDVLTADEMTTDNDRENIKARGKVTLFRKMSDTETWKGFGDSGFYNTKSSSGDLLGDGEKAHLIHTADLPSSKTRQIDVYANRFHYLQIGPFAEGHGQVYGHTVDPLRNQGVEFWSDQAHYLGPSTSAVLLGGKDPAHVFITQPLCSTVTRHIDVFARKFDFFKEEEVALGSGEVYGKTIDPETKEVYEFWSDRARYDGRQKKVILTGETKPRLKQMGKDSEKFIEGDEIVYDLQLKSLKSSGNARAIFVDQKPQKGSNP